MPAGLRALGPLASVENVGDRTVVLSACAQCLRGDLLVLAQDGSGAKKIGTGSHFVPALDGRAVWVWDQAPGERCTVRRVPLAGGSATGRRAARCDRVLDAETHLGLLWADGPEGDESVIDSLSDGTEVFRARSVKTVVGRLVLSDPAADGPLRLTDTAAGTHVDISRPTAAGSPSRAMVAPDGRTLAISFDHPAWPGPRQRMDLWLLDLPTRTWRHAPAMPVHAALRKSGMAWMPDGRLVLLGSFDEVGDVLALWRPGDARWALREVDLPAHGASDFVVLTGS